MERETGGGNGGVRESRGEREGEEGREIDTEVTGDRERERE
jgi:hypothetical protein